MVIRVYGFMGSTAKRGIIVDGVEWTGYPLDCLTTRALAGIKNRIFTLANNQLCGMVTTGWVWCGIVNISPRTQAFRAWNTQLILYSMKPTQGKLFTKSFDVE